MNSLPWYRQPSTWLSLGAQMPWLIAAFAGPQAPVTLAITAAVGLGTAIYNAAHTHSKVTGLQVALVAADAAKKQLEAAAATGE